MIRSNVPMPLLFRLRLRAKLIARRAQAGLLAHRGRGGEDERAMWTGRVTGIDVDQDRERPGGVSPAHGAHAPNLRRVGTEKFSREMWTEFIDRYERFISALCSAAKDGCSAKVEREYAGAQWWFATHYKSVAPWIGPYLDVEFRAEAGREHSTGRRDHDVIEGLFRAASLRELLTDDGGDLIPRIGRISEAIYRCNDSLEK